MIIGFTWLKKVAPQIRPWGKGAAAIAMPKTESCICAGAAAPTQPYDEPCAMKASVDLVFPSS